MQIHSFIWCINVIKYVVIILTLVIAGWLIYTMVSSRQKESTNVNKGKEKWVFLVHGVLRSSSSMSKIEKALQERGFKTHNFNYDSRKETIKAIAKRLHKEIAKVSGPNVESINFVTHSFGTIVVRYYCGNHALKKKGRFVMIAPPNKGSQWARILSRISLYKWVLGIAGGKVQDVESTIPKIMSPLPMEFGVIAGGTGMKMGINPLLPGDDDGTITVEETKLEGMKDFIQIRGQHSLLLLQQSVIDNVIHFLETGVFIH